MSGLSDKNLIEIAVLVLLLIGSLNFIYTAANLADYHYDLDYSEGFVIQDAGRLADSGNLYPEPDLSNGFQSVKYPPAYYVAFDALEPILGGGYLNGRVLNLMSTFLALAAIAGIIREKTGDDNALPLLFLVPFLTIFTGSTIRVDMLSLAFSLSGIYMFLTDRTRIAAILSVLALFTKQSFVAGAAAIGLILFLDTDWDHLLELARGHKWKKLYYENRDLADFGAVYAGSTLLLGGLILAIWPHFLDNILYSNLGGFSVRVDLINWLTLTFLPLSGLGIYYLYVVRDRLLGIYFGISTALMILQLLRGGAWVYSAIEPFAVLVIMTGILYSRIERFRPQINAVILFQLLLFFAAPIVSGTVFDVHKMPAMNSQADRKLSEAVRSADGPVYVEDVGFEIGTGKKLSPETWGVYEQYSNGHISRSELISYFQTQNYSAILAHKRLYDLPLENYISNRYSLSSEVVRYDLLLHKQHWRIYR
ncbi:MAG: hypothetical protein ABEJ99_00060 [Candidatus Nanohaloarchaea archaeon]